MVRYENTSHERIELVFFYESELGQPLLEQIRTCSASSMVYVPSMLPTEAQ